MTSNASRGSALIDDSRCSLDHHFLTMSCLREWSKHSILSKKEIWCANQWHISLLSIAWSSISWGNYLVEHIFKLSHLLRLETLFKWYSTITCDIALLLLNLLKLLVGTSGRFLTILKRWSKVIYHQSDIVVELCRLLPSHEVVCWRGPLLDIKFLAFFLTWVLIIGIFLGLWSSIFFFSWLRLVSQVIISRIRSASSRGCTFLRNT